MKPLALQRLQSRLGHTFSNDTLLTKALTHRSACADNNERLEFLGDSILNFTIAEALYQQFPSAAEGALSRMRASLVKEDTLASIAKELELGDELILGPGELKSGGFRRASILSDAVEALIGAIYLDEGMAKTQTCILSWYVDRLESVSVDPKTNKDAKTALQEWLQSRGNPLPVYELIQAEGEAHQQVFKVSCAVPSHGKQVVAEAASRKKAEKAAAKMMLTTLGVK